MITSLIVAAAANEVIGDRGELPWRLPADLRRFRAITTGQAVVMGRATHESILARLRRPLPGRTSVVLTRGPARDLGPGVLAADSLERGLALAAGLAREAGREEIFVIGGASVYAQALPAVERVYLTRVNREAPGDAAMPAGWLAGFALTAREDVPGDDGGYSFLDYRRERR